MFGRLKAFYQRTMDAYEEGIQEEMEPWKKEVLRIHEESALLFYMDEMEELKDGYLVRGELVKGKPSKGERLKILSGEGELLARARITEASEAVEVKKKTLRRQKEEIRIHLLELKGEAVGEMDEASYRRLLRSLLRGFSLMTDDKDPQ